MSAARTVTVSLRSTVRAAVDELIFVDTAQLPGLEKVVSGAAAPRLLSELPACRLA
jgi:hypothetical protein